MPDPFVPPGTSVTHRVTSLAMERAIHLGPVPILDHGFLRVVDYMGDDSAIVQAARVSMGAGTKTARDDVSLIRYLMRHKHGTPFEMAEVKFHVKLPIFVARQWIRHRMASVNETSARYSILAREFYVPPPEAIAAQAANVKQGRGDAVTAEEAEQIRDRLTMHGEDAYAVYELLLNDAGDGEPADGDRPMLARELARMALTLNHYTEWYWKVDVRNLFQFLALRMDAHAQWEFRQYAGPMGKIVEEWLPAAWSAFRDYELDGVHLSGPEWAVIRRILKGAVLPGAMHGHLDDAALQPPHGRVRISLRERDALVARIYGE